MPAVRVVPVDFARESSSTLHRHAVVATRTVEAVVALPSRRLHRHMEELPPGEAVEAL